MQRALSYRVNRDLFSNHYLDDLLPETEAWQSVDEAEVREAYDSISALFEDKADQVESFNEHQLERHLIRPVFNRLDLAWETEEAVHGGGRRPDYAFFEDDEDRQHAFTVRDEGEDFYRNAIAVGDAKRWGRPLDKRSGHEEEFSNPSFQIHIYLQQTPPDWGILTNGKQWRLYYAPSSYQFDSYYEIDLPTVLDEGDLEAFRYFYLFFRRQAFVEDSTGRSFLDRVHEGSNAFAQELGDDLRENIYEAIGVLAEGFLQYEDALSAEDLDLIHDASLTYLYRLIFVLYAESEGRHLLDTREETYRDRYSLTTLKREVCEAIDENEDFYPWETRLWDRLDRLFTLIDRGSENLGIDPDQLYVPAYDGGLFKTHDADDASRESQFLQEHSVGDEHLSEVIDLLTRRKAEDGSGMAFVDYSSLGVRHLGSIYEGLLEYQLNVAQEPMVAIRTDSGQEWRSRDEADSDDIVEGTAIDAGDVYLTTDTGERKATGSYYTPEYVVQYIIKETLDPLVDEIRADLLDGAEENFAEAFADRVFDLNILDPAMGSGHFLVDTVDYLAKEIMKAQEQQGEETDPVEDSHDVHWARRQIAQRCIYGVDLNPMATELAKVSLWLRTLAAEQPLAFLDHHLKTGNSLVGSDIEDVLENGAGDDEADDEQLTLTQSFDRTRRQALEHVTDRFQELLAIDNETLADIREMETVFEEVREDPLYRHLLAMANVHTADEFGLDVPSDAYERMAAALRDDSWEEVEGQDWFRSAQAMAEEEHFFHWELEFPVAFYGEDGERDEDAGFDAVIGNPPYMRIQTIRSADEVMPTYFESEYRSSYKNYDIYALFLEKAHALLNSSGEHGYIVPHKFMQAEFGEAIRSYITEQNALREVVDMGHYQVFGDEATTYTCLLFLSGRKNSEFKYKKLQENPRDLSNLDESTISSERIGGDPWILLSPTELAAIEKIENCTPLQELSDKIFVGIQTSKDSVYALDIVEESDNSVTLLSDETGKEYEFDKELLVPYLKGEDVNRYEMPENKKFLIFPYHTTNEGYSLMDPDEIQTEAPQVWDYLLENRDVLESRDGGRMDGDTWYAYTYPKSLHEHDKEKILTPEISDNCSFTLDKDGHYSTSVIYSITASKTEYDLEYLLAVLNSATTWFYVSNTSHVLRGGYYRFKTGYLRPIGIPELVTDCPDHAKNQIDELKSHYEHHEYDSIVSRVLELKERDEEGVIYHLICDLVKERTEAQTGYNSLNLNLLDYLGNYLEGQKLPNTGRFQPTSTDILDATTEDHEKLNIGEVRTERDGSSVTIYATARYKPEDEDEQETDRWGYTETEYLEAFTLAELSETEAALVEAFVPVAVEEADGFAGFRDNATKTTSLVDRLKAITLPDPDDVEDDLRRYLETKERADELDEKIEKTDKLVDEIVYELYGLSEEEIEIVEESVGN